MGPLAPPTLTNYVLLGHYGDLSLDQHPINASLLAAANLPVLVDEKKFEVATPRQASRITHHRLAAFISKWGME